LQNGGYYFALSDHYDLTFLGDYYTKTVDESSYAKRYAYRGNLNFRFENLITASEGIPITQSKIFTIYNVVIQRFSKPKFQFSASVNLGSSKYFQRSINQANIGSNLINTLNSSISYSKTFQSVPQVRMSLSATH
jgi:lipopolysaccharide assembly outer membrane protein LptD (OstA)